MNHAHAHAYAIALEPVARELGRPYARLLAAKGSAEEYFLIAHQPLAESSRYTRSVGLGFENIVGVGVAERVTNHHLTGELAVSFYVIHKVPRDEIDRNALIPPYWEGFRTDVIESGQFLPQTRDRRPEQWRYRPPLPGVSLGHADGMTGTFGFLAIKDHDIYAVSSNHVFSRGEGCATGDLVLQPGLADDGTLEDYFADVALWVPLQQGTDNLIDAAGAWICNQDALSDVLNIGRVGKIPYTTRRNRVVCKCGRATGVSYGVVWDVDNTSQLPHRQPDGTTMHARMVDQILVVGSQRQFSEEGDSGALVIDFCTRQPIGIVCGGGRKFTVVNKITHVLNGLGVLFA